MGVRSSPARVNAARSPQPLPTAPTTGPPAACPSASSWLLNDSTVARTLGLRFWFSHALYSGQLIVPTTTFSHSATTASAKSPTNAKPITHPLVNTLTTISTRVSRAVLLMSMRRTNSSAVMKLMIVLPTLMMPNQSCGCSAPRIGN